MVEFLQVGAVIAAAQALSLLTAWAALRSRCMQLYSQRSILYLAMLPGFAVAKLIAVQYAGAWWQVVVTCALVEFAYGCRWVGDR